MDFKNNKKLLAVILTAAMAVAAVPTAHLFAAADGAADANTTGDVASTEAEGEQEKKLGEVNANGEMVMEGEVGKVPEKDQIKKDKYEVVAENEDYRMYFYEPRVSVILEDKLTGRLMYSTLMDQEDDGHSNVEWNGLMKSGINATAIVGTVGEHQLDLINTTNQVSSTKTANGVDVNIKFTDYGLGLTMKLTLDGNKFNVTIPQDSIVEEKENNYFQTITPFPFMGYTHMDDHQGYMLVPDGNGALIYLTNKEGRYSSGFSGMVYGKDDGFHDTDTVTLLWDRYEIVTEPYQIMAPIFGMAHTDDRYAYLGVIESGDKRAYIQAEPNGAAVNYNRTSARFIMRVIYPQPMNTSNSGAVPTVDTKRNEEDLSVSYFLLTGNDASYMGMAKAYRQYLLDHEMITKGETEFNSRVDFLGTDREEFLIGTRAVTMTRVEDLEDKFNELRNSGVSSLVSVYKGWQKGGVYDVPIRKYKADSHIGGTGALTRLVEEQERQNYHVYLYDEALRINASTNSMTFDAVKMVNKRTLKLDTHQEVFDTFYYQMPNKSRSNLDSFVSKATGKGAKNIALGGVTRKIFSYSSRGKYFTRKHTADIYEDMLKSAAGKANLALEQPSAYLWKYASSIIDMPLGSSSYMYLDQEVPFLSLVLKGIVPMYSEYVNFEANKQHFLLNMAESGVFPSFYLTAEDSSKLIYTNSNDLYSTEYETYRQTVVDYDKKLRGLADKVGSACISNHEILGNGVTKVTYDNGVVVYVNYSDTAATVDNINVDALSFEVGDAR